MADETQVEILKLLDVISIEVAAHRNDTAALIGELRGELHSEIGGLRGEVGGLRGEVGQLRTDVGQLRMEIGYVRSEMRAGFERVDRRFGELEARIETLER